MNAQQQRANVLRFKVQECVSASAETTPPDYRYPMQSEWLTQLAACVSGVSQLLKFGRETTPYERLDGQEKARADFAARVAVNWLDDDRKRDAILRVRQALADRLYKRAFHLCSRKQRAFIFHLANESHSLMRLTYEGISPPLHPNERHEMLVPEDSTFMSGGDAA